MKVSKVKSVASTGQTWRSKSGEMMYVYDVLLEDGIEGQANSTSEVGPPYQEGDEIEYEITRQNQYGRTLRIRKYDPNSQGAPGGGFSAGKQKEIATQWAINAAIAYLSAVREDKEFIAEIGKTAKEIMSIKGWLMEDGES